MKPLMLLALFLAPLSLLGQDTTKHPVYGWRHGIVSGFSLTQVSYSNWSQGGENSLAYALSLQGNSTRNDTASNWATEYNFAYGQARLGDQGVRKTDDRIDISTVFTYKLGTPVNPYMSASLKTQFSKGYQYDNTGAKTAVSDFFDPAYLVQAAGAGYQPLPEIKTRLGLALREILTSHYPSYADDPATPAVEKTSVRGGLEEVTEIGWHLDDNLALASTLELFSAFKAMDEVVVRNDNSLSAKVNKYVTVILNVQIINEKQITPRTQVKETLAIGLIYSLL